MEKLYKLYTDGSNQNYNKLAGYGGYIEDEDGNEILSFSEIVLDSKLNSRHELLGLKKGLELAVSQGIKNIVCYTDDMGMARLFNTEKIDTLKEYIKHPLEETVLNLKNKFENINFFYIPREENKQADKLSRQALKQHIKDNNITGISDKNYFTSDKFFTSQQFKNKKTFAQLTEKITNYFIFNEAVSNKVDVYLVEKQSTEPYIQEKFIKTVDLKINNQKEMLEIICATLEKYTYLKTCAFFTMSGGAKNQLLEDVLRSHAYITPFIKEAINKFEKTVNKFDSVFYHRNAGIEHHIRSIDLVKFPNMQFVGSQDNIVEAIRLLGEDDYYIGKNPVIEVSSKIKKERTETENIIELQKYYFGQFLKIAMKDTTTLNYRISKEEKENIVKERIESLRNSLTSQGIKLKM